MQNVITVVHIKDNLNLFISNNFMHVLFFSSYQMQVHVCCNMNTVSF